MAAVATEKAKKRPRIIFLNFRVFARSAETPLERQLVRWAEGRAVALAAAASVALCESDADDLSLLARESAARTGQGASGEGRRPAVSVLLPPLRREFAGMPAPLPESLSEDEEEEEEPSAAPFSGESDGGKENVNGSGGTRLRQRQKRSRNLFLCCVRLSPEKEPHRFVEVVEALARNGVLSELGVVPALVGGGDGEYARGLRERMRRLESGPAKKKVEALVEGGFLDAGKLASRFFERALLNFHPCLADAYGMSAVEAGSRGAPSVIHRGSDGSGGNGSSGEGEGEKKEGKERITVGASALLRAEEGESIALDLSLPAEEVAARVAELLRGAGDETAAKVKGGEGGGARAAKTTTTGAKAKEASSMLSLREVGERAQRRARSWGEREHGEALAALARRVASSGGG